MPFFGFWGTRKLFFAPRVKIVLMIPPDRDSGPKLLKPLFYNNRGNPRCSIWRLVLPIFVAMNFLPQKKTVFWASKKRFSDPFFWAPSRKWRAPPPIICLPRGPEVWGGDLGRQPCSPVVERIADGNGVRLPVIYVDGIEGQSNAIKQCRVSPAECKVKRKKKTFYF